MMSFPSELETECTAEVLPPLETEGLTMNQYTKNIDLVPTPAIFAQGSQVFSTSRDVATFFAKRHDHVIRGIENLILQEPGLASDHIPNFGEMVLPVEIGSGATRMSKAYRMTRTGFTLLAMGFTGEKALRFKLRYIAAFDELEAKLRAQAAPQTFADALRLGAAQAEEDARLTERKERAENVAETYRISDHALTRFARSDGSGVR